VTRADFGIPSRLVPGKPTVFPDGLELELTFFTHRRVRVGDPRSALAGVEFRHAAVREEVSFPVRSVDAESDELILPQKVHRGYLLRIVGWLYAESLDLVVKPLEARGAGLGELCRLEPGDLVFVADRLYIRLLGFGQEPNAAEPATMLRFVRLELFTDGLYEEGREYHLYETGLPRNGIGRWVGPPGLSFSGFRIELVGITPDIGEIKVFASSPSP
jgi:hypothetical protein